MPKALSLILAGSFFALSSTSVLAAPGQVDSDLSPMIHARATTITPVTPAETTATKYGEPGQSRARFIVHKQDRPTIALALGGGGARCAAHIGVLKVLQKEGIPIDYISGNSMGAIVGGMYAAGVPLDSLEQMYRDRSIYKAFTPVPPFVKMLALPVKSVVRSAQRGLGMQTGFIGLYRSNKVAEFVSKRLPAGRRNIEDTVIPFAAVTSNLLDGKTFVIESGDLGKALQASAAAPFYMEPVAWGDKLLVDGGLRGHLPTFQARKSQTSIVIAVNVDENLQAVNADTLKSMRRLANRVNSMVLAEAAEHQARYADLEIRPSINGVTLYSRNSKESMAALRAGEEAAIKAVPRIRELMTRKLAERATEKAKAAYTQSAPDDI